MKTVLRHHLWIRTCTSYQCTSCVHLMYILSYLHDLISCLVGLPANLIIVFRIILKERLYSKPRNILLLNITLCNIHTLIIDLIEMVHYLRPSEETCLAYISLIGLSYDLFFFNVFLSLLDRYVAISHPMWHRQKVTVSQVIVWTLGLNVSLVLAIKWIFIRGTVPFICANQLSHAIALQVPAIVFLILSIVFFAID